MSAMPRIDARPSGTASKGSLRVALVAPNVVRRDGQGRVMVELCQALVARGHQVTVLAHRCDDDVAAEVDFRAVRRAPGPQIVDDLYLLAATSRALRRIDHDVAMVMGPCGLGPGPCVYNAQFSHHGWRASWAHGRPPLPRRIHVRFLEWLTRRVVRRCTHVIASTPRVAADVTVGTATPASVVPDGVDVAEFPLVSDARRSEARLALGLDADERVVAFLGDYHTPRKGLDPLLRAIAEGPGDERLVVASRGDDGALERRAADLGVTAQVMVAGFAPPDTVIAAADVVAVPSLYEPFSLVAFEAAASGVPLVLSRRAGAAELLAGCAHEVDDPSDPSQLRAALDGVWADPAAAHDLTLRARRVAETMVWPDLMAQAVDVLESVAVAGRAVRRA